MLKQFPLAYEFLSILHLNGGASLPKDKKLAIAFMQKAAQKGVKTAQYNLGCIHSDDDPNQNLKKDRAKVIPFTLFFSFSFSFCNLSMFDFFSNKLVTQSLQYFESAAALGHLKATTQAAIMRAENGDQSKAVQLFTVAAKWGDATAQFSLVCGCGVGWNVF
jgi:TPR repeat protein